MGFCNGRGRRRRVVSAGIGLVAAMSIGWWGGPLPAAAADPPPPKLEVATDARAVELFACPGGGSEEAGDAGSPGNPGCAAKSEEPYLGGQLTLLVRNGSQAAVTMTLAYLAKTGTSTIPLPGDSDRVFLIAGGEESQGFFKSLLGGVTGKLKGRLLDKVEAALPKLAQIAVGRVATATRLAKSPTLAKLVAAALRGGLKSATAAEIRLLGPALGELLAPQGRKLSISSSEVRDFLAELGKAVVPPGVEVASEALKGAFGLVAELAADSPLRLEAGKSRVVAIGFALPPGEPATAIDGSLTVGVEGEKPSTVPVTGAMRPFKGVSVAPSKLSMTSDDDAEEVTLAGPDLVEFLRFGSFEGPTATLYSDAGDTTSATLELPSAETVASSDNPNRSVATVVVDDADPPPGKYTGKLSLTNLSTDAAAVEIELHSHRGFPLLVVLVLAGVIAGGVLTRLATTAVRRRLLRAILEQTVDAYRHVLGTGATKSWRLEDLLGEDPLQGGASPGPVTGRLQGLPALRDSIETARSSADLDEDADRVLDMIARMQRWLRVEPLARRLSIVAERSPSADPEGLKWSISKTLRDTRALLETVRREPADVAKADDLVGHLLFQIEWHNGLAAAWDANLDDADHTEAVKGLDEALGTESKVASRTGEEQDVLEGQLRALVQRLPGGTVPSLPAVPGDPEQGQELENGITPVKWDASSNLFTGWATLDAQSYGQLTRRAATSARAQYVPSACDMVAEVGKIRLPDLGWTLVALTIASIAYGAAEYDDTWGTCQDLATAFLAGVLGKVTVNWAALPIFQSIRLRASKAE